MAALFARKEQQFNSSIYVISDEPYREIVYDGAQVPFVLDFFRNGFIGYSYSKSLSLPGERIGYIAVNNRMDDYEDILSSLNVATRILGFVNAPSLFQKVIARTLGAEVDVQIYRENRDPDLQPPDQARLLLRQAAGSVLSVPEVPDCRREGLLRGGEEAQHPAGAGVVLCRAGAFPAVLLRFQGADSAVDAAFTALAEEFF